MRIIRNSNRFNLRPYLPDYGFRDLTVEPGEVYFDADTGIIWMISHVWPEDGALMNLQLMPRDINKAGHNDGLRAIQKYVVPPLSAVGIHVVTAHTAGFVGLIARAAGGTGAVTKIVNSMLEDFKFSENETWGYYAIDNGELVITSVLRVKGV